MHRRIAEALTEDPDLAGRAPSSPAGWPGTGPRPATRPGALASVAAAREA